MMGPVGGEMGEPWELSGAALEPLFSAGLAETSGLEFPNRPYASSWPAERFPGTAEYETGRSIGIARLNIARVRTWPIAKQFLLVLICVFVVKQAINVLIFPPFGCDTASVYRNVILGGDVNTGDVARQSLAEGDIESLARKGLFTRLTPAAMRVAPDLGRLVKTVERVHEWGCWMSGSGSTLFALAPDRPAAHELAAKLRALPALKDCGVKVVQTLTG